MLGVRPRLDTAIRRIFLGGFGRPEAAFSSRNSLLWPAFGMSACKNSW